MIVPSIDLQGNCAVQLVEGKTLAINAGDPLPIAKRFSRVGEIAPIDLDAAMGKARNNRALIEDLVAQFPCRVGGGIRDLESAYHWLDAGASRIILGTQARPELLQKLPKDRVIAALDARHGQVVVDGWTTNTGKDIWSAIEELRPWVSGFLVTQVEREGRLEGLDQAFALALRRACKDTSLTFAGGITTAQEVALLDRAGIDAQVGMALYTEKLDLAEALGAMLNSDRPDGLWPTVVSDAHGFTLGLAYSNLESLRKTLQGGEVHCWSRKRGLWCKGASSGATQSLLRVSMDCDKDTLQLVVQQEGHGFCHLDQWSCFGEQGGSLSALERRIRGRIYGKDSNSYSKRLVEDPALLHAKILEEAGELVEAQSVDDVAHELADLFYFGLVKAACSKVSLRDVEAILDKRALRVRRRPGNAKKAPQ